MNPCQELRIDGKITNQKKYDAAFDSEMMVKGTVLVRHTYNKTINQYVSEIITDYYKEPENPVSEKFGFDGKNSEDRSGVNK